MKKFLLALFALFFCMTSFVSAITITVTDATTLQLINTQTEAVLSPDTVYVDLSNLPSSIYNITIELDNSDIYYADIQIWTLL